jgi:hypothetical protein
MHRYRDATVRGVVRSSGCRIAQERDSSRVGRDGCGFGHVLDGERVETNAMRGVSNGYCSALESVGCEGFRNMKQDGSDLRLGARTRMFDQVNSGDVPLDLVGEAAVKDRFWWFRRRRVFNSVLADCSSMSISLSAALAVFGR